ncbi:MAG: sigma-70 family RNA polymerase sigma factor [Ruminococcaceae bacterium]|nr:sigma-70 family RNA polymerase sigma factor [Oscillospiraceae bacterium]
MLTFTEAYTRYYPSVMKNCRKFFADEHTARDATQETLYKLMIHWDELYDKEALDAWLKKVAYNTCVDIYRKQKKEIPFDEIRQAEFFEEDIGKELFNEAKEIVKNLPSIYREIFHLSFVCGYTGQQIADRLCIPLSTVKTRVRVCLQKIQASL